MSTRVIIAGGRDFQDYNLMIRSFLSFVCLNYDIIILSGSAKGADKLGERLAKDLVLKLETFPADWNRNGKSAGFIRNSLMAEKANMLIAFWDGESRGTSHMIKTAKSKGLSVNIVAY